MHFGAWNTSVLNIIKHNKPKTINFKRTPEKIFLYKKRSPRMMRRKKKRVWIKLNPTNPNIKITKNNKKEEEERIETKTIPIKKKENNK